MVGRLFRELLFELVEVMLHFDLPQEEVLAFEVGLFKEEHEKEDKDNSQ